VGEKTGAYRIWWGQLEKRPLGRHGRRWGDNIKVIYKNRISGLAWIDLAQDNASGGCCECDNETSGSVQCEEFLD
jgi:hypothetical protein